MTITLSILSGRASGQMRRSKPFLTHLKCWIFGSRVDFDIEVAVLTLLSEQEARGQAMSGSLPNRICGDCAGRLARYFALVYTLRSHNLKSHRLQSRDRDLAALEEAELVWLTNQRKKRQPATAKTSPRTLKPFLKAAAKFNRSPRVLVDRPRLAALAKLS